LLNQRVGKFVVGEKSLHNDYLFYVISSSHYQKILFNTGSGSGQPNLSPQDILQIEIPYPPYEEQCWIARTLRTLDDKIDVNTKINHNLPFKIASVFKYFRHYEFHQIHEI
jgi:type I restriction enzyme S subunit